MLWMWSSLTCFKSGVSFLKYIRWKSWVNEGATEYPTPEEQYFELSMSTFNNCEGTLKASVVFCDPACILTGYFFFSFIKIFMANFDSFAVPLHALRLPQLRVSRGLKLSTVWNWEYGSVPRIARCACVIHYTVTDGVYLYKKLINRWSNWSCLHLSRSWRKTKSFRMLCSSKSTVMNWR